MTDLEQMNETQAETITRYQRANFRLQERVTAQQDIIDRQREQIEQLIDRVEWLESPQYRAELHFGGQGNV